MPNRNPTVDKWFDDLDHPLKAEMLAVRQALLEADDRVTETIKWSSPTFEYQGPIASFQPRAKKFVSLLFHRGSEIPGDHPHLEGDSTLARVMRFEDLTAVKSLGKELQAVIRAWCQMKDG